MNNQKIALIIATLALVLSLATAISVLRFERGTRELDRLQGVFNDKTIEFAKLVNENPLPCQNQ